MTGYRRDSWLDETGLKWVNPSPNLRSITEAALYPGVAMVEGANVSVGRGTSTPFELLGAPWVRGRELADYLNRRNIDGVQFLPVEFTPESSLYKGRTCRGTRILLKDRGTLDSALLGIEIASALHRLFPRDFKIDGTRDPDRLAAGSGGNQGRRGSAGGRAPVEGTARTFPRVEGKVPALLSRLVGSSGKMMLAPTGGCRDKDLHLDIHLISR